MPTNKMTGQRNMRRSKNQKIGGQKQTRSLRGGSSTSKSTGVGRKSSTRTSH